MQRWYYAHSGVTIASELELPEWSQCETGSGWEDPDATVRLESPHLESPQHDRPEEVTPWNLVTATEYRLLIPKVGHFHVRDGREIRVSPMPGVQSAIVRPWMLGPVWGALCYQRGFFLIHASAVRIGNDAVIFCGRAGRGKSTLAAQLGTRGYALVSDDLCRLDLPAQGPPVVYPSPPRMKLWSDTLGELGWGDREAAPDHLREGKFHLSMAFTPPIDPLPVRGAYLLAWGEFGVRELHGMAALHEFLSGATYRMRMLESMGQVGTHSRRCMEFLRHVPFAELTKPRDFSVSARTLDFLADRLSNTPV